MNWKGEVVASGLQFPEGPVYLGPDELIFVEIRGQRVTRYRAGTVETVARPGGGPNGATAGVDGFTWQTTAAYLSTTRDSSPSPTMA